MSFLLYEIQPSGNYKRISIVELAGKDGPLVRFVTTRAPALLDAFEWHLSEAKILEFMDVGDVRNHAVFLDLKPNERRAVRLARVRDIWGVSYRDETSVALRLEIVVDERVEAPGSADAVKECITQSVVRSAHVYQFLHLKGGTRLRLWNWLSAGRSREAVLLPDALEFFLRSINGEVREAEPEFSLESEPRPELTSGSRFGRPFEDVEYARMYEDLAERFGPAGGVQEPVGELSPAPKDEMLQQERIGPMDNPEPVPASGWIWAARGALRSMSSFLANLRRKAAGAIFRSPSG